MNKKEKRLISAVLDENINQVEKLIRKKVNINVIDEEGRTPLMRASWRGFVKIVNILVEAGAEVNITDNFGRTALTYALHWGNKETIAYLENLTNSTN